MDKSQTQASYETRLNRVIDHIYKHLDDDLHYDNLAEVACLSPYHWHRIYKAMRGETIGATIRRLRLLRAADRLANSDAAISTVANRAAYGSVDAFGRAFKETYGQTPADYRANGSHSAFKAANRKREAAGFAVITLTLPPVRCAAVAHAGAYMQIDRAMGRLFTELASQRVATSDQKMIAVFFDDPDLVPTDKLRSEACSPVADNVDLAPPLNEVTLRGGLYAKLRYKGPYADMKDAYRWMLGVWLPSSGHEADNAPVFEAYLNSPMDVRPADLLTEIHLPLKAS
jgi:AraC family transcriptional regulator